MRFSFAAHPWAGRVWLVFRGAAAITVLSCLLAPRLTAELEPALVQDGFIRVGSGPHALARLLDRSRRRPGHVSRPQVPNYDTRVVLAEFRAEFVQVVAPDVADPGVEPTDAGLGPHPVLREFPLVAHGPLIAGELLLLALERIDRGMDDAVRECDEARRTYVHPDDAGGLMDLPFNADTVTFFTVLGASRLLR